MSFRSLTRIAIALAVVAAGAASAESLTTLEGLKKGATLAPGQAGLLIVVDRGLSDSAVNRPPPLTMVLVAVADGKRYRIVDVQQPDVYALPPGKYFVTSVYTFDRRFELDDIHTAAEAFELKAGVLNYAGQWKFSNDMTKVTGKVGLEMAFAPPPLDEALRYHPEFVKDGMVYLAPFGKPSQPLGKK